MSPVASTSAAVALPTFPPSSSQSRTHSSSSPFLNFSFHTRNTRRFTLFCQSNPNPNPNPIDSASNAEKKSPESESETEAQGSSTTSAAAGIGFPEYPDKNFNRRIAVASAAAGVGLFLSTRLELGGSVSLKDLSASALPYEEALSNGKPTVVEFYADWCEVCRELAPDVYRVEQQYKDKVNFVMLNVDNTKWEQELDEFGVEGIPHFSFLDKQGNEEGYVVGRLPAKFLLENISALAKGEATVPHAHVVGQYSNADQSRKVRPVVNPRSHG